MGVAPAERRAVVYPLRRRLATLATDEYLLRIVRRIFKIMKTLKTLNVQTFFCDCQMHTADKPCMFPRSVTTPDRNYQVAMAIVAMICLLVLCAGVFLAIR